MVLINCPECTKKVSSEAVSCPKCGYPVAQKYKEYEEQAREARKAREDRELAKKIEEATKRAIANKKAREAKEAKVEKQIDKKIEEMAKKKKAKKDNYKDPINIPPLKFGKPTLRDSILGGKSTIIALDIREDKTTVGILIDTKVMVQEEKYPSLESLSFQDKYELLTDIKNKIEVKYNIKTKGFYLGLPNSYSLSDRKKMSRIFEKQGLKVIKTTSSLIGTLVDISYYVALSNRYCIALDFRLDHWEMVVVQIQEGIFDVIDIDYISGLPENRITEELVGQIIEDYLIRNEVNIKKHLEIKARIREEVEANLLRILSSSSGYRIYIPYAYQDKTGWRHLDIRINKKQIDKILFMIEENLKQFLSKWTSQKGLIWEVFVFGEIGKLERVKSYLQKNLSKKLMYRYNRSIQGLGILAGMMQGLVKDILLLDGLPSDICIRAGNELKSVVGKGSTIPTKKSIVLTTTVDNQNTIKTEIIERCGLTQLSLGTLELAGIEPNPKGTSRIKVTIDINSNMVIKATIQNLTTKASTEVILPVKKACGELNESKKLRKSLSELFKYRP